MGKSFPELACKKLFTAGTAFSALDFEAISNLFEKMAGDPPFQISTNHERRVAHT
jgi:hypothetical protein